MTDFLLLHNIEVPVRDGEWKRKPQRVGDMRARTNGGQLRDGRIAIKDMWTGKTPILPHDEGEALIGLLLGDGHVFSFDVDPYSSKGLIWSGAQPGLTATAKFGGFAGSFASGTTYLVEPAYDGEDQTVLLWRRQGAGSFDHYAMTRTKAGVRVDYKNGVAGSYGTTNWSTLSDGGLTLLGKNDAGTNTTIQTDDLVILPFLLTPAQIASVAAATTAWGDLPTLRVSGQGVDSASAEIEVLGNVTGVEYTQASTGASWISDNVEIDFTLETI